MMGARSHENSTIEYLTCNRIVEKYGVSLCTNNKFHAQFIKVHKNEYYLVLHLQKMEDFMSKKIDLANFNNQCRGNV